MVQVYPNLPHLKNLPPKGAGGEVGFAVRDTGIGLAPHDVAILRNGSTFYQADSSSKRRYGGLGLGLTLVKAMVKAHGGQLDIESELGRGSCFALRLPTGQADSGLACGAGCVVQ
jgi:signal transduction histidine kinase